MKKHVLKWKKSKVVKNSITATACNGSFFQIKHLNKNLWELLIYPCNSADVEATNYIKTFTGSSIAGVIALAPTQTMAKEYAQKFDTCIYNHFPTEYKRLGRHISRTGM